MSIGMAPISFHRYRKRQSRIKTRKNALDNHLREKDAKRTQKERKKNAKATQRTQVYHQLIYDVYPHSLLTKHTKTQT
jgi:hypothetical protein